VFTPEGSAAWLQVESLRRYLAQAPPTATVARTPRPASSTTACGRVSGRCRARASAVIA
jgi:hypothetical protein